MHGKVNPQSSMPQLQNTSETIEYKLMRFDGLSFGYVIFKTVGPKGVAIKKAIYLLS